MDDGQEMQQMQHLSMGANYGPGCIFGQEISSVATLSHSHLLLASLARQYNLFLQPIIPVLTALKWP